MASSTDGGSSYWYSEPGRDAAVDVLKAVRRFHSADAHMRQGLKKGMDMNATDLTALRILIAAEQKDSGIGPKDLSRELGISTAAMAKLLARLSESGHVRRTVHPMDRRAQLLFATPKAHDEVRKQLASMHERMLAAAAKLTPDEQRAFISFLDRMSAAIEPDGEG